MGDPWSSGAGTAGDPGEGMRCFEKGLSIVRAGIWAEIQGLTWMEGEVRERHLLEGGLVVLLRPEGQVSHERLPRGASQLENPWDNLNLNVCPLFTQRHNLGQDEPGTDCWRLWGSEPCRAP